MLYLFGKKLGTQHYPTVAGVGYTTPTYEIMDVGCWVHNNQLYKSWLLGTQQPTNFRRCVVLCWFLLVQPMSGPIRFEIDFHPFPSNRISDFQVDVGRVHEGFVYE